MKSRINTLLASLLLCVSTVGLSIVIRADTLFYPETSVWTVDGGLHIPFQPTSMPVVPPPPISVPAGYGRYCSVVYSDGRWDFKLRLGQGSDPCDEILKASPGGVIMRAGLWSEKGENNVMLRCQGGGLGIWREKGDSAAKTAYAGATGQRYCIFNVSPTRLPIFTTPYGKTSPIQLNIHSDVVVTNVHNFNLYQVSANVRDFGQSPSIGHSEAHTIDRKGRQLCRRGSKAQCCPDPNVVDKCQDAGCHFNPSHGGYDWIMPEGKPIKSVAAGVVVMARARDVSEWSCTKGAQKEIYIKHEVGSGGYRESFITYYAHLSRLDVSNGNTVTEGQTIGLAGDTGCSSASHLHFGTARLSNTSGFLEYPYATTVGNCGDNGFPVSIDPFGWAAPKGIDPFAWLPLGNRYTDCTKGNVANPGAFSIALWKSGMAPPNKD